MKCPFRIKREVVWNTTRCRAAMHEDFEPCHEEECPFYYTDENDVSKCSRCDGGEEDI